MKLKRFGFFENDAAGKSKQRLRELVQEAPHPDKEKILEYLSQGKMLMAVPGICRDLLDPKLPIIDSPNVLTDKTWAWTKDVVHYVQKYNVTLPENFLGDMERNKWKIPVLENVGMLEV